METFVSLADRTTALIVGGDEGAGAEIAISLGARKVNVIIPFWSSSRLANQVVAAVEERGGTGIALLADVTDKSHVDALLATGGIVFGKVDYVIWCRQTSEATSLLGGRQEAIVRLFPDHHLIIPDNVHTDIDALCHGGFSSGSIQRPAHQTPLDVLCNEQHGG